MPEWVWIPIVVIGAGVVIYLTAIFSKEGGALNLGKGNSFILHGERGAVPENPLGRALKNVPENIGIVHAFIYGRYLKAVKDKGVDPVVMTEIEDARLAKTILRNATSLGNGSRSVQKLLENSIANQDYVGVDTADYVKNTIVPLAVNAIQSIINSEYDSVAHYAEHSTRHRIVSQAEFVDILTEPEFQIELAGILLPFYTFAERCLSEGSGK